MEICNQGCGKLIQFNLMKEHIENECENSLIDCPLKDFGCNSKIIRKELNQHINQSQSQHFIQLIQQVQIQKTTIQQLKDENISKDNQLNYFHIHFRYVDSLT